MMRSPPLDADTTKASTKSILALAYVIGAALALVPAVLPLNIIIPHILYEDSFYYLQIAKNIISGHGVTLDGVEHTNGFHPLWMMICMTAEALGNNHALRFILVTGALLHMCQAILIFRILSPLTRPIIAHMCAVFWILNYRVMACNICGMETPLVTLMALLVVQFIRKNSVHTFKKAWILGGLLGLTVAARFDMLLFAALVLTWLVIDSPSTTSIRKKLSFPTVTALASIAILSPWFIWSTLHSGSLLPNSRKAFVFIRGEGLDFSQPPKHIVSILTQKILEACGWLSDTANFLGLYPFVLPSKPISYLLSTVMALLFCSLVVAVLVRLTGRLRSFCALLWLFVCIHVCYYVLFAQPEIRYLIPGLAAGLLVAGCVVNVVTLATESMMKRRILIGCYSGVLLCTAFAGLNAWQRHQGATRSHVAHRELLETAQSLALNIPTDSIVGAWNAGIMSYYSGITVVNLDGAVNDSALSAIESNSLAKYVQDRGITHVVDFGFEIVRFMDSFGGNPNWRKDYKFVYAHRLGRVHVLKRVDGQSQ